MRQPGGGAEEVVEGRRGRPVHLLNPHLRCDVVPVRRGPEEEVGDVHAAAREGQKAELRHRAVRGLQHQALPDRHVARAEGVEAGALHALGHHLAIAQEPQLHLRALPHGHLHVPEGDHGLAIHSEEHVAFEDKAPSLAPGQELVDEEALAALRVLLLQRLGLLRGQLELGHCRGQGDHGQLDLQGPQGGLRALAEHGEHLAHALNAEGVEGLAVGRVHPVVCGIRRPDGRHAARLIHEAAADGVKRGMVHGDDLLVDGLEPGHGRRGRLQGRAVDHAAPLRHAHVRVARRYAHKRKGVPDAHVLLPIAQARALDTFHEGRVEADDGPVVVLVEKDRARGHLRGRAKGHADITEARGERVTVDEDEAHGRVQDEARSGKVPLVDAVDGVGHVKVHATDAGDGGPRRVRADEREVHLRDGRRGRPGRGRPRRAHPLVGLLVEVVAVEREPAAGHLDDGHLLVVGLGDVVVAQHGVRLVRQRGERALERGERWRAV
mmetsp:Transcript_18102/g.60579  ORF Transcript_18102/g.60579 Transcript_18102/m.60579 type:complete len:494 (-) Transcript_18102:495-1976(-)